MNFKTDFQVIIYIQVFVLRMSPCNMHLTEFWILKTSWLLLLLGFIRKDNVETMCLLKQYILFYLNLLNNKSHLCVRSSWTFKNLKVYIVCSDQGYWCFAFPSQRKYLLLNLSIWISFLSQLSNSILFEV